MVGKILGTEMGKTLCLGARPLPRALCGAGVWLRGELGLEPGVCRYPGCKGPLFTACGQRCRRGRGTPRSPSVLWPGPP